MARIFVSYSRKNKDFCRQLTNELQQREIDFWVDWGDIEPTVDWSKAIQDGIESADTFLAIVTPDWITSPICQDELNIAVRNGKRLIPVVPCEIPWNSVPADLAKLNFIFFTESFDFNEQLNKLFTALDTDYDWLKTHRRLQVKAIDWERSNKESGFLLRGKDLEDAEAQISVNANKDPHPTDLQREYILLSRQAATRQRRVTTGVLAFIIFMLAGITAYLGVPRVLELIAQSRARGEMVLIPEGPSIFGTENSILINDGGFPARQSIESLPAFKIDKYEVSNYQYGLCVKYGNCTVPVVPTDFEDQSIQNLPVVSVTLFQANAYCRWLGERLPNQFEWERAARGPDLYEWPWGNEPEPTPETANMPSKDYVPTSLESVDSNPAGKSPEGIYNLIGNASEWTSSLFVNALTYDTGQIWDGNPESFDGTKSYSRRGGGWRFDVNEVGTDEPDRGLSARNDVGFRCAANVE